MDISGYITGITNNITNQTQYEAITPVIVGNGFTDLAYLTKINVEAITGGTFSNFYTKSESDSRYLSTGTTITIPFSGLTNIPNTLSGYTITSGDTLFDSKYQPIGNYISGSSLSGYPISTFFNDVGYINASSGDTRYLPLSSGATITANTLAIFNLQTGLTYVETILSGATSLSALTYSRSSPATRTVGGVSTGDIITGYTLDALLEKILAPYTAPTITNTVLTPNPAQYNQQNVNYNVTYRWVQNVGTPNFVSAQMQYRRGSSGSWNNLSTTANTINSTTQDALSTILINTGGTDNTQIQFQCLFTDLSQIQTGNTATGTFSAYAAPTTTLSVGTTIREYGDVSTNLTGTITRNSPNVNLTNYVIQYETNGSSTYNFVTGATTGSASATINTTDFNTGITTSSSIGYRVLTTDTQQTTTGSTQVITFLYRIFYGPSSVVPTGSTQVRALSNSQLTNGSNTFILNTGTAFVNFILALPPGKSLVSVIDLDALNLDITAQYTQNQTGITVNNFYGNPVSYQMYPYTQSVPYTSSHRHQITIA